MIDKAQQARRQFISRSSKPKADHTEDFKNTGALLTRSNKIILPHAEDADFNSETACKDYLKRRLTESGSQGLADEAGITLDRLVEELLDSVSEQDCKDITKTLFTKKVL